MWFEETGRPESSGEDELRESVDVGRMRGGGVKEQSKEYLFIQHARVWDERGLAACHGVDTKRAKVDRMHCN